MSQDIEVEVNLLTKSWYRIKSLGLNWYRQMVRLTCYNIINLNVLLSAASHHRAIIAVLPAHSCKYFWASSWTENTHSVAKYEMLLSITISHNLLCSSLLAVNFSRWAQFRWWYHVWRISMKNVVLVGWYSQILLVINIRLRPQLKSWAIFLTS